MTAPAQTQGAPFLKGSIIWQKKGPLPVWAWLLIGLAVMFIFTWWRRNRNASVATEATSGYTDELPGDQTAPPIFIIPPARPALLTPRRLAAVRRRRLSPLKPFRRRRTVRRIFTRGCKVWTRPTRARGSRLSGCSATVTAPDR